MNVHPSNSGRTGMSHLPVGPSKSAAICALAICPLPMCMRMPHPACHPQLQYLKSAWPGATSCGAGRGATASWRSVSCSTRTPMVRGLHS